ncbi:MAG TPA: hypothetical protein DCE07_05310 [Peptococcaceae bacterium]|nr:hypothetical protein [Peptococcaceae bacterium]
MGELIEKFKRFATPGEVGLYNSCSLTSVVLTSRKNGLHRTIAVFEELPFRNYRLRYHTERPIRISKDLSLGVASQRVMIRNSLSLLLSFPGVWRKSALPTNCNTQPEEGCCVQERCIDNT